MPERIPLREYWQGPPVRISSGWNLTKGTHVAECVLYAHEFGWELRLLIDRELPMSQVRRSTNDVLSTGEQWKAAMIEKGWT